MQKLVIDEVLAAGSSAHEHILALLLRQKEISYDKKKKLSSLVTEILSYIEENAALWEKYQKIKTKQYLKQAALGGHIEAMFQYGVLQMSENDKEGLFYLRSAFRAKHGIAAMMLGDIYMRKSNYNYARHYYEQATVLGEAEAHDKILLAMDQEERLNKLIEKQAKLAEEVMEDSLSQDVDLRNRLMSCGEIGKFDEKIKILKLFLENDKDIDEKLQQLLTDSITWLTYCRDLMEKRMYSYPIIQEAFKDYKQVKLIKKKKKFGATLAEKFAGTPSFEEQVLSKVLPDLKKTLKYIKLKYPNLDFMGHIVYFKDWVMDNIGKEPEAVCLLHDSALGTIYLHTREAFELLQPTQGDTDCGHHLVKFLNGVHFKKLCGFELITACPGIEYMITRLHRLVIGHGCPPTRLIKVTKGDVCSIYQASRTVRGANLQYIVTNHKEYLQKLDMNNFAAMIVVSLLSNPQDGKPDNYIVEIEAHSNQETGSPELTSLYIVGIDNDMAFGKEVVCIKSMGSEIFSTEIRNILYLLPNMDFPIPEEFLNTFLSKSPELILVTWLLNLFEQNNEYEKLLASGLFTMEEFCGITMDSGLNLPIRLEQGLVGDLYRKLTTIQQILKETPNCTCQQLFEKVQPTVAAFYTTIRGKHDIVEGFHAAYLATLDLALKTKLIPGKTFHDKASWLIYEARNRLKREISVTEALDELLNVIPFAELTEKEQVLIMSLVKNFPNINPSHLLHSLLTRGQCSVFTLQTLLENNADINWKNEDLRGYNALHLACKYNNPENIISWILFSQNNVDINAVDEAKETPLDKVYKYRDPESAESLIQLLKNFGAKTNAIKLPPE